MSNVSRTPSHSNIAAKLENLYTLPHLREVVLDRKKITVFNPNFGGTVYNATGPAPLQGTGTGNPLLTANGTSEIAGFLTNADNESVGAFFVLPDDMDVTEAVNVFVYWSNSAAASANSCKWIGTYREYVAGTTAVAVPATAYGTNRADQVCTGGADVLMCSAESIIAAAGLTATLKPGVDAMGLKEKVDLTTITDATLWAILVEYGRQYI